MDPHHEIHKIGSANAMAHPSQPSIAAISLKAVFTAQHIVDRPSNPTHPTFVVITSSWSLPISLTSLVHISMLSEVTSLRWYLPNFTKFTSKFTSAAIDLLQTKWPALVPGAVAQYLSMPACAANVAPMPPAQKISSAKSSSNHATEWLDNVLVPWRINKDDVELARKRRQVERLEIAWEPHRRSRALFGHLVLQLRETAHQKIKCIGAQGALMTMSRHLPYIDMSGEAQALQSDLNELAELGILFKSLVKPRIAHRVLWSLATIDKMLTVVIFGDLLAGASRPFIRVTFALASHLSLLSLPTLAFAAAFAVLRRASFAVFARLHIPSVARHQ